MDAAPSWDRRGEIFSTYVTSSERLECRGHLALKPSRILRFFRLGRSHICCRRRSSCGASPSADKHLHILRNLGCVSSAHKMRAGTRLSQLPPDFTGVCRRRSERLVHRDWPPDRFFFFNLFLFYALAFFFCDVLVANVQKARRKCAASLEATVKVAVHSLAGLPKSSGVKRINLFFFSLLGRSTQRQQQLLSLHFSFPGVVFRKLTFLSKHSVGPGSHRRR